MDTKKHRVFLMAALAAALAWGPGVVSASPVYENHFDVYRTVMSGNLQKRGPGHAKTAKHRPASTPVVLSDAPHAKSTPGARSRSQ